MRFVNRIVLSVFLSIVIPCGPVVMTALAGTLDDTGSPEEPGGGAMYALEDIYNRLDAGTEGAKRSGAFIEPSSGPTSGTGRTLDEVMGKAPARDDTDGAVEADVLSDKTFWGVTGGEWGPRTGTMPNRRAVTYTPGTVDQPVAAGYHNGSGKVEGDADLTSDNIKLGKDIFGVTGNVIKATGNAAAGEVLIGRTFSNDGGPEIGTMPDRRAITYTPDTADQAVAAGYHNGAGKVEGDADLLAANIKCGVTIFGVTGTLPPGCVAKTGQTTCYNTDGDVIDCSGTGQDGEYEQGCDLAVPPTGGFDFGNYNRTSLPFSADNFRDNGDGTVTDKVTCLIWLKNARCFAGDWASALSYCNTLANGSCGLTDGSSAGDWRLPNINELRSLFDPNLAPPYLPLDHPFEYVELSYYWASTTVSGNPGNAWHVGLSNDDAGDTPKYYGGWVWAVRGGQ